MKKQGKKIRKTVAVLTAMAVGLLGTVPAAYAAQKTEAGGTAFAGSEAVMQALQDQLTDGHDPYDYVTAPLAAQETMPAKYDLRDQGLVTPVKFQNPFGSCWGFAAIAAAETSILSSGLAAKDGYDKDSLDLSEKHLAYFVNQYVTDEEDPQYGEGTHLADNITGSNVYNTGGTPYYGTSLFASGIGPNLASRTYSDDGDYDARGEKGYENNLGYHGKNYLVEYRDVNGEFTEYEYDDQDDWSIPDFMRYMQSYTLKESSSLPDPAQTDVYGRYTGYNEAATAAIKSELLQGRAVAIGFCADTSQPNQEGEGKYLNNNTWAHYTYDDTARANHAVTIVGYDDDYAVTNFIKDHQPEKPGAWIVKNSWGSEESADWPNRGPGWGVKNEKGEHTGYFYLSYYDKTICMPESYEFDKSNVGGEYYLDQHDLMPTNSAIGAVLDPKEGQVQMANAFTAEVREKVEAISFETGSPQTSVEYSIYLLNPGYDSPTDGVLVTKGNAGPFDYGGFHKLVLPEKQQVLVQKGQSYSIVIHQTVKNESGQTCDAFSTQTGINEAFAKQHGYPSWEVGVINAGESYIGVSSEAAALFWQDLSDSAVQKYLLKDDPDAADEVLDNFPIKGYATEVASDCYLYTYGARGNLTLTKQEGKNQGGIYLSIRGKGNVPKHVAYTLENEDPAIAEIAEGSSNNSRIVKALDYGTTHVKITATNKDTGELIGTSVIRVTVQQADNTLTVTPGQTTVKYSKLKKKKQKLNIAKVLTVSDAEGPVTYQKTSGNKKITVSKVGKVTLKKDMKKGVYKVTIRVSAAGTKDFKAAEKTATVSIKVK